MAQDKVKIQHYGPRTYLSNFSQGNEQVFAFDNQFHVADSERFVFSRDGGFSLVESMLDEAPSLGSPNRERIAAMRDGLRISPLMSKRAMSWLDRMRVLRVRCERMKMI